MVTFVYFIFSFFFNNFCKELRTSGVGWLHDSILSPVFFEHFLQRIQGLNLAGVSLNIARSSSASRVHLGPRFSNLMVPLSSAQVLLPCPS